MMINDKRISGVYYRIGVRIFYFDEGLQSCHIDSSFWTQECNLRTEIQREQFMEMTTLRTHMLTETTSNEAIKGMTLFADHEDTQWIIQHLDYDACEVTVRERFTGEERIMQWNSTMFVLPF